MAEGRVFCALLERLEGLRTRDNRRLAVLTYHRVDDEDRRPDLDPSLISATPDAFRRQMAFLRERCRVVSLEEVVDAVQGGRSLPPRAVLVTFDDAYRDFAIHAWPIMKAEGLPVTLFVPTAFPGQPNRVFWWDRLHQALRDGRDPRAVEKVFPGIPTRDPNEAIRRIKRYLSAMPHDEAVRRVEEIARQGGVPPARNDVLDWDALRQLAREGVTLAPHTRTHPLLTRISPDEARNEIADSFTDLQREVNERLVPPAFAFPGGAYNASLRSVLEELGVRVAFLTQRGTNRLDRCDPLQLDRINVGRYTPLQLVRLQIAL